MVIGIAFSTIPWGCGSKDFIRIRERQTEQWIDRMEARSLELLPPGQSMTLDQCVDIALLHHWNVKRAEMETRLAKLDRRVAFSVFLPAVNAEWTGMSMNKAPTVDFLGMSLQMGDRNVTEATLQAQMPVFSPQAWFAYSARRKSEDISLFVLRRTRQLIALRVMVLYYSCLSLERLHEGLLQSAKQAEILLSEVKALYKEGLATPSEMEATKTLLLSRQYNLSENERDRRRTQAELLWAMGLSPNSEILLEASKISELPEGEVDDWILEALLNRPEMAIADRSVEIRKDQVKMAIAGFLPGLGVGGAWNHTSDSFSKYSSVWIGGVSAVLTVFDGFANVAAYQAARQRHQESFVQREEASVTIMLEVLQSHWNVMKAMDVVVLTRQVYASESLRIKEVEAQYKEGWVRTSDLIEAIAQRDNAVAQMAVAEFQAQIATAILWDVMGKGRE